MRRSKRSGAPCRRHGLRILTLLLLYGTSAGAFDWPSLRNDPWPHSSERPVSPLTHPTIEAHLAAHSWRAPEDLRFVAYGDQRALADGEWQDLIGQIVRWHTQIEPVAFIVDTGDIVGAGNYSDQFAMLHEILTPVRGLPYLVGVGNHEVKNNAIPVARSNTASLLSYLDPHFSTERMYYRKDIGPWRLLFLDSNDLVYELEGPDEAARKARVAQQMAWFAAELETATGAPSIVIMHHPLVQSSRKHREHAIALWNFAYLGRTLAEMMIAADVELVLTGHTHTYERFIVGRDDGRHFHLVNLSGRPRNDILWFGASQRRARDIAGEECAWLTAHGWPDLAGWQIIQADVMTAGHEANQYALFTLGWEGRLEMEVHYLDEQAPHGLRGGGAVQLR